MTNEDMATKPAGDSRVWRWRSNISINNQRMTAISATIAGRGGQRNIDYTI